MQSFGKELWLLDGDPVRFNLAPFETRMAVARLQSGGLWLHSPAQPNERRFAAVRALGPVEHLVAPNRLHAWRIEGWRERFPRAAVWASRRARVEGAIALDDAPPPDWADEIDQAEFRGHGFLDEVVFCHRASRALILTDLIQAHDPSKNGLFWRLVKRAGGVLEPGGVPRDLRATFRDRDSARASLDRILSWDFDRCVIAHGRCIESGAKDYVRAAFRWLA